MFDFLRNLFGYVEIEISGESCEKFLNMAHKKRVSIWNLRYKNGKIIAKVWPKDFRKLIDIKRKTRSKINILKKSGLIFKINKYSNRTGLLIGMALFVIILKTLSFFVLGIEINANTDIDKNSVISVLDEIGVTKGMLKKNIDTNFTAQKLMLRLNDISWASVNIEGSIVNINIKTEKQKTHNNFPSNLIAKTDGTISKIDVVSGETQKSVGDVVAKGEVLVSGISYNGDTTVFERSKGKIFAKTNYTFTKTGSFKKEHYITKTSKNKKVIKIVNLEIPLYLGSIKQPYTSKIREKNLKILNKNLPIQITEKTFSVKTKKTIIISEEELKNILTKKIKKEIKNKNFNNYEITACDTEKTKKTLTVKITVSATENIAKETKIKFG